MNLRGSLRRPGAVLAAGALVIVLAATAGCTSKIGVAATYNGHTITDSQIADYLTPKAQPVQSQQQGGGVTETPARTFVLNVLLQDRLFDKILDRLPGGHPSDATIQDEIDSQLQGQTPDQIAQSVGVVGYSESFVHLLVRDIVLNRTISSLAQQGAVDPNKLLANLDFDVTVSPRYGTWDPKSFSIDGTGDAGAPDFVSLEVPTSTEQPATQ